ncbi:molybdenum cofactor biosynthesis protein MoaE [Cerasicoccus fimbriatus]|uniref:molybdenum cofactor biosynthesis protein MoaE n=1 Tax=Cerasicoccus fimbriatus TaxID=3014554 RepID=UPI0022B3C6FF|nr:molybdenum cofactor biosynthesis protein MoaE [Cerasicoccus sp. TK19100]
MFTLTENPINEQQLRASLLRVDAGGFCCFEGWVRDHHLGRGVIRLEYQAYANLATKQGAEVLAAACKQYDLLDARAEHRIGNLSPGDMAVWVGVCSVHRDQAFEACRFIIDEIKATVPVWKHEFYTDGRDEWVDPTACHCDHRHPEKAHHH